MKKSKTQAQIEREEWVEAFFALSALAVLVYFYILGFLSLTNQYQYGIFFALMATVYMAYYTVRLWKHGRN